MALSVVRSNFFLLRGSRMGKAARFAGQDGAALSRQGRALLSSSQRRPAKLPGVEVDLQSRGLSLLRTSVPDAPQPKEGGAVLPREPRCLPHP